MRNDVMILGAVLSCAAGAANAAEYEFTVPIALSAMPPEIAEGLVGCQIFAPRVGSTGTETIGLAETRFPIAGGAYAGDVRVGVNRSALAGSRTPTRWSCYLRVYGRIGGAPVEFWSYEDPATGAYGLKMPPGVTPRLEIPAAAGAPKTVSVTGTF